jgi:hypothetical protein
MAIAIERRQRSTDDVDPKPIKNHKSCALAHRMVRADLEKNKLRTSLVFAMMLGDKSRCLWIDRTP